MAVFNRALPVAEEAKVEKTRCQNRPSEQRGEGFCNSEACVARLPAHITRAFRVFLSMQNLICGYGGMAVFNRALPVADQATVEKTRCQNRPSEQRGQRFCNSEACVAWLPAHITRALRVFLSKQNLICGYGGMADTLVLGTSAFGVQVQVLLPAPQ